MILKQKLVEHRYIFLRKGIGFYYAEKDGSPVLKHQAHWYKIVGIWINTDNGCTWWQFRRFTEWQRSNKRIA